MNALKPYMLLACVAFMVGFVGYWALGHAFLVAEPSAGAVYEAPVSAPLPDAGLGAGKHI